MKKYFLLTAAAVCSILLSQSCRKENIDSTVADKALFAEIKKSGYTYYVGTPGITAGVGNSPHGFERVRFNSIAQAALDTTGKLPAGNSFPAGSIIVKEIFSSATGSIIQYAVMKKDPSSEVAGSGYLWAEFDSGGGIAYSISKKGDACISCHSGSTHRDLVRTFDLH